MRTIVAIAVIVLVSAGTALAQPASRFEIGPVVRVDKVFLEGGAGGMTVVVGAAARVDISSSYGVEAELTRASSGFERSYQGWFTSFAPYGATREEIERLAPTARRTLGYTPGTGWSAAFVARGEASRRVIVAVRAGASGRRYRQTSTYTLLTVPDGIDPADAARTLVDSSASRTRGGLLLGSDVTVALTDHLSLAPEVRFVYGGPARVGDRYRELGFGARAVWRF